MDDKKIEVGGFLVVTLIDGTKIKMFDLLVSTSPSSINDTIQSLVHGGIRISSSKILGNLGSDYSDVILLYYPPHMIKEIAVTRI